MGILKSGYRGDLTIVDRDLFRSRPRASSLSVGVRRLSSTARSSTSGRIREVDLGSRLLTVGSGQTGGEKCNKKRGYASEAT